MLENRLTRPNGMSRPAGIVSGGVCRIRPVFPRIRAIISLANCSGKASGEHWLASLAGRVASWQGVVEGEAP